MLTRLCIGRIFIVSVLLLRVSARWGGALSGARLKALASRSCTRWNLVSALLVCFSTQSMRVLIIIGTACVSSLSTGDIWGRRILFQEGNAKSAIGLSFFSKPLTFYLLNIIYAKCSYTI